MIQLLGLGTISFALMSDCYSFYLELCPTITQAFCKLTKPFNSHQKLGVGVYTMILAFHWEREEDNVNLWKSQLHSEFQANLGYTVRPYHKRKPLQNLWSHFGVLVLCAFAL